MSRDFWIGVRQATALFLDVLERELRRRGWWNKPLTAELRKESKRRGYEPVYDDDGNEVAGVARKEQS